MDSTGDNVLIEHPMPTDATAKRLYALAVRCAYPDCQETLYREDDLSETWVLNSRICHICARSEDGPRWEPDQTADENRSDTNLLLMCIRHASVIDEPAGLSFYTKSRLHEWKAAQMEEHRQLRRGWPLTTAMAQEALAASVAPTTVVISHSILNLGGEGGRSPGAGGGGGGAVGAGAQAGKGGNGGVVTDFDGTPLPPTELAHFLADVAMDPPPGAGGAGAGALGPGSIGGDGGNGGDGISGMLSVEPGDRFDIEIGEGGQGGSLPGQHGAAGGDAVLTHRSSNGDVKQVLRARGGQPALSGSFPEGWLPVSREDVDGGLRITALLTANSVDVRDGLIFILGGGWSRYPIPSLPFEAVWTIVCVASWRELSEAHARGFHLCLLNPDGNEVSRLVLGLLPDAVKEKTGTWIQQIGAPLDKEGAWRLQVRSGEFLLQELSIVVTV